jgi:hypothetical protein
VDPELVAGLDETLAVAYNSQTGAADPGGLGPPLDGLRLVGTGTLSGEMISGAKNVSSESRLWICFLPFELSNEDGAEDPPMLERFARKIRIPFPADDLTAPTMLEEAELRSERMVRGAREKEEEEGVVGWSGG